MRVEQETRYQLDSFPRSVWELVVFVSISALVLDVILLAIAISDIASGGSGEFPAFWQIVKGSILVLGLGLVAAVVRSFGMAVAVALLGVYFVESWDLANGLSELMLETVDLAQFQEFVPASANSWAVLLTMVGLAMLASVVLRISGYRHSPFLAWASKPLNAFIGLLVAFSGIWEFFGEVYGAPVLNVVAGFGTLVTLSLAIGYTVGLVRIAALWYES